MMELLASYRETGTPDELGIGTIGDALADHFFPGSRDVPVTKKAPAAYRLVVGQPRLEGLLRYTLDRIDAGQIDLSPR